MELNSKKQLPNQQRQATRGCSRRPIKAPRRSQHRGTITIAVLVCIGVVMTIAFSAMTICIQHRRQLRDDIRIEQTRWVLDGSVRMAISKIRNQPNYTGETFNLETPLSVFNQATVVIQAIPTGEPDEVQLKVVAELHRVNENQKQETIKWKKKYRRSANLQVSLNE